MMQIFFAGVMDDSPIPGFNKLSPAAKERLIVIGAMARHRKLAKAQYETLAAFRYALRQFLRFSEEAARRYAPDAEHLPQPNIAAIAHAVEQGTADEGLAPLENSQEGSVPDTLDLLIHDSQYTPAEFEKRYVAYEALAKQGAEVQVRDMVYEGRKVKNYYVQESVGIAPGMLITALHHAGLASLTHTPSPMGFLNAILDRPSNEKPFLLLVVGRPADDRRAGIA